MTEVVKELKNPLLDEWVKALAPAWAKDNGPKGLMLLRPQPLDAVVMIERLVAEGSVEAPENEVDLDILPFRRRRELVTEYAWAVPTMDALLKIQQHSPNGVVEIGAGTGYWAGLLRELGVDVVAYDEAPYENFQARARHSEVLKGVPFDVRKHPERTLFLCWPPYGTPMAATALHQYEGDTLVYIGEDWGGCTGNEDFHAILESEWTEIDSLGLPQWPGIHDALYVYRRKGPA